MLELIPSDGPRLVFERVEADFAKACAQHSARRTESAVLLLRKLKKPGIILKALKHNRRTIQAELTGEGPIDPGRSCHNEILRGAATPSEVAEGAAQRMADAGIRKMRCDAVRGIEIVVTLHPETRVDQRAFFLRCADWVAERFGGIDNLLSADIHRDEGAPHAHFVVLPLIDGRMNGSRLFGGPAALARLQADFHRVVAVRFGMRAPTPQPKGKAKTQTFTGVLTALRESRDPAMKSVLWPALRVAIEANPACYAELLGVEVARATKKERHWTETFISPGKGPRREVEVIRQECRLATEKPMLCRLPIAQATRMPRDCGGLS